MARPDHACRPVTVAAVCAATCVTGIAAPAASASPPAASEVAPSAAAGVPRARADAYRTAAGAPLVVPGPGVLRNDSGDLTTVVAGSAPAHGRLTMDPDGSFRYQPDAGFTGTDSFTYTTTDAVHLYRTRLPPLAVIGGVTITGGAFGSSLARVPGSRTEFYGLTDRGPNVDHPDGAKVEPLPDFTPQIGRFRLSGGTAVLERRIPLRAPDGTPYTGRLNCGAGTGETITDLGGNVLPCSDTGYDPEGLVALPDGTFWVSDEYGPFITHFDSGGRQLGRLSPLDGSLPRELANRTPNRGMEGLTLAPDGHTLVGVIQSALRQPDLTVAPATVAVLRIVTVDLLTGDVHEYPYLLDDPQVHVGAVSEITALSATTFLVDERDAGFAPAGYKRLVRIDLAGATDIGPRARIPGARYDAARGGLLVGEPASTLEAHVGSADTATAAAALAAVGITPVRASPGVDVGALVATLDPLGGFFGHDKIEGVAALDGGRTLLVSNDSDFGILGLTVTTPPYQPRAKLLPGGRQDDGEILAIRTDRLPATLRTATVTITVG